MDVVELPYPVNIAVPTKLMGSEGLGGARVTVKQADDDCEPRRVSILVNSSIERCSTSIERKDATSSVDASKSASWHKIPEAELCRLPHQLASFHGEDSSEQLNSRGTNCLLLNLKPESAQLQRKAGKVSRSSSGHSKRLKVAHLEDTISSAGVDDLKDISNKQGSYHTKCNSPDKTQLVKQKNNFTGKRVDKRSFKVPVKMASFNSAAGGNNLFGLYGLKSDINDVTKLVDDLSLNELLDGTYECPILGKEKEKKVENMNVNFLNSVRKASSILPLPRPVQSQNYAEADSCSSKKFSQFLTSSVSMGTSGDNSDKGDSCATDLSSSNKDCCNKPETPSNLLDFPLCQPKDVLERLALPPPKDLESLLQDAAKPSQYSKNTSDLRSGKQIARRVSLPPFPWSHALSGHCRTNSDAVKFPTSRSTCQGRWVRIGNIASSLGTATDSFTNLESLTYDQNLVPSGGPKLGILENTTSPISGRLSWCEWGSSSVATFAKASHVSLESQVELKDEENAGYCPLLLAAAQTLYDIATQSLLQNPDGLLRWPKKPSQKVMKARKLKSVEKPEEIYAASTSVLGLYNQGRRGVEQIMPSKRPKVSTIENKRDLSHTDPVRKGSINWLSPRSSRSSLISARDSIAERRHSSASTVKQSCMMPPPARVSDKACSSQQKLQKLMPMDWDRQE